MITVEQLHDAADLILSEERARKVGVDIDAIGQFMGETDWNGPIPDAVSLATGIAIGIAAAMSWRRSA